ncbi:MAG: IS3 family transposase [Erysipelotrichaceae bacterium]|nr:IS3 family transposase [Erysipelotrichaceae bacterium]
MCEVLNISKRTYYKYRNSEDKDYYDYLIIKEIFEDSRRTYGSRRIAEGLKVKYGVIFNRKKIQRIMNKYYLKPDYYREPKTSKTRNCETRFFLVVSVIFVSFMTFDLLNSGYAANIFESLRISAFNFVTTITTTGFVSVKDMEMLPPGFVTFMILGMLIGGNQESTGGGIKQYRVIVALKGIYHSIRESIMNCHMVISHRIWRLGDKEELTDSEIRSTSSYIIFYFLLFLLGSLIFTMYGYDLQDSMFEFSSAISTVGLSLGITNYNASPVILWTAIIGMFLGRMEIMVVFKAFLRIKKDIRNREN